MLSGISFAEMDALEPLLAALKVLAAALVDTGNLDDIFDRERVRADVQETEAILSGYWEGVLEESRWDLAEQRASAAAAAANGRGAVVAGAGEEDAAAAVKKSKAAKRKQQKRKAQ